MNSESQNKFIPTVLIADDDSSTRILLRAIISPWHYPIIEASDGEEAWELLNTAEHPQIAIIDWMMPKMDGPSLCHLIKKLPKPPYIMLISNRSESANIIEALDSGADDFLAKPFNYAELRSRLLIGQRIIRLEAINEEHPDELGILKTIPKTIAKMSTINQLIDTQLKLLDQQAQRNVPLTEEDRDALQNTIQDIYINQQQLTSEINNLKILYKEQ